jgi:hypothetical protein
VRTRSLRPGRDLRLLAGDATAFCAGDAAAPTRSWPRAKASGPSDARGFARQQQHETRGERHRSREEPPTCGEGS